MTTEHLLQRLLRHTVELLFSLLASLLVVSLHEGITSSSWARVLDRKYLSLLQPQLLSVVENSRGVLQFSFLMVWTFAICLFLALRLSAHTRSYRSVLGIAAGLTGVVGFPAIQLIAGIARFLALEVVIVSIVVVFIGLGRWHISTPSATLLALTHFALWGWAAKQADLETYLPFKLIFWPEWNWVWHTEKYAWLFFLAVSILLSTLWFAMVKQSFQTAA